MYHDIKLKSEKIKSDYDVTLDDFKLHLNIASNYEDPPKFTFDDGKKSSLIAADLLNLKNMKGIFFVITGLIGRKDYLNKREINYLSDKGHIIGSHSHSHSSFDVLSDKKAEEELIKSKKILEEITGSKIFDFAFPGGKKKNHHTSLAKKIGYKNIYTSYESYNKTNDIELSRFHIRQSTKNNFEKICKKDKLYLLKRIIRSNLIKFKSYLINF